MSLLLGIIIAGIVALWLVAIFFLWKDLDEGFGKRESQK